VTIDHSWPSALIEDLQTGNVVPFVGAGFSVPSGLPSWPNLLSVIVDKAAAGGLPELRTLFDNGMITSLDAPELHQILYGSRFLLMDYVLSRFSQPAQPNSYHLLLEQLHVDTIITTNYDKLIERHFESRGDAVHPIWKESHITQYNERSALQVVKLHGHVDDPESIVLSRSDYDRYIETHRLLYSLVSVLFSTRTILFLGCSLTDPNVRALLEDLRRRTGSFTRSPYVLIFEPTAEDTTALRSLGLQVVACHGANREVALESWLDGLVTRSQVVATSNSAKSQMINDGIRSELPVCLPGAIIRMRAAMGIISNPRTIPAGLNVYGDEGQDALEVEMGDLARQFLRKHDRNRIRTIVHIDPLIQLRKFPRAALRLRLNAMAEFLAEFGRQIEIAQSDVPVSMNHVIIGDRTSFLAFKNTDSDIGYKTTRVTRNRWTIRSEIDAFDSDFREVVSRNRARAAELGIDVSLPDWSTMFARALIVMALDTLEQKGSVLECDDEGTVLRRINRTYAHEVGIRHCSVHLCLFATQDGRRQVLLQRRARHQHYYPGMVSVAVTGHPELPDALREVLRECSEELGLWLDPLDVTICGTFPRQAGTDVEVVTLFRADVTERAPSISWNVSEDVDSLYWVDIDDLCGDRPIAAVAFDRVGSQWKSHKSMLSLADIIPGTLDEIALAAVIPETRL
jgi:isopentenyldiphosphate isomerase